VIDNVCYVGTEALASFLITTPEGQEQRFRTMLEAQRAERAGR